MNVHPEALSDDRLNRRLRLLQPRRGHRAGSDDVLLAGVGLQAAPAARAILDLGSGQGTVALLLADALPEAIVIGIEAQPISHRLAVRNAARNRLQARYRPILADLRNPAALPAAPSRFDLITGAPPFMPLGTGVLPRDPQRAAARFELRGGVEAYLEAAARWLAPCGRLVLLMDGQSERRTQEAIAAAGLCPLRLLDVRPRPSRPPVYQIFEATWSAPLAPAHETLCMRAATGEAWSAAYRAIRQLLALDPLP